MTAARKRTHAVTPEAIAELQNRILSRTSDLIAQFGVDRCSLTAVARSTGHSIGMIQHHFATRDALILASIEYRSRRAVEEWREIGERREDPLVTIGQLLEFSVEGKKSFTEAWGFWMQTYAAAPRDPEIRRTIAEALDLWRSLFVETVGHAKDTGRIGDGIDTEVVSSYLVAAIDGLAIQALSGVYGHTPDSMNRTLRGLTALLLEVDESEFGPVPDLAETEQDSARDGEEALR